MDTLTKRLHNELKPLYAKMLEHCEPYCLEWEEQNKAQEKVIVPFVLQWGKYFPTRENDGILFVGRATNDWHNENRNVDDLFDGDKKERIFARSDQMTWANDYNSAFWRVIRSVSNFLYCESPLNHIAWSNLCKLAPNTGNPNNTLYHLQLPYACNILQKEVDILSPKVVVIMTGIGWADDFICALNNNGWPYDKIIEEATWSNYNATIFEISNRYIILSEHPQGKDEDAHVKCLINLIKNIEL